MEKNTRQEIDRFLECRTIAVAGASRDEKSFSASVIKHLKETGRNVFSVNPNFTQNSPGSNEYRFLADIPEGIDHLLVLTTPSHTTEVIRHALQRGIGNIWIQQKSETPEALEMCRICSINLITNHCIFMFTQPEGFHKFHYGMKKFFGTIPR